MASSSRNVQTYEAMGKLPSSTLKRHPKMDLNKNDLLRLLSYLEGELQARDISIAALKAEKAKQLLYQAKYGRFGLGDPFHALQRDSDSQKDNSFNENAVKAMYDNQLVQLENLIATQRRAQQRMREQLVAVEKRYHKACSELEEEKQKHAMDTAQGDDVTYMLEKDRERLKQELDFDKSQMKKLEKENKKLTTSLEEEQALSNKHKQVALVLIKERKHYMEKLAAYQHHNTYLDHILKEDKTKLKTVVEGLAQEGHKSLMMEAALEKQLSEFDIEREQLKGRLAREEVRNGDLVQQLEQLKAQLAYFSSQTNRGASPVLPPGVNLGGQSPKVFKDTRVPVVHVRNSPDRDSPVGGVSQVRNLGPESGVARHPIVDINNGAMAGKLMTDRTIQHHISQDKPVPAQKPAEFNSPRTNVITSTSNVFSSASGNSTVYTTPSGTRISLNVGSNLSASSTPRKPAPLGRGIPPPIPPNKPQVYLPPGGASVSTPGRRDNNMVRSGDGVLPQYSPLATDAMGSHVLSAQQPALQKLGITISKDKITITNPHHSGHERSGRAGPRLQSNPNMVQAPSSGDPTATGPSKPAQPNVTTVTKSSDASPSPEIQPSQNLDSFGPEMEDLQKLLVSMATDIEYIRQKQKAYDYDTSNSGPSENSSSSVESSPTSSVSSSLSSLSSVVHTPHNSTLHRIVASGHVQTVDEYLSHNINADLTITTKDGCSVLHTAAELGYQDILDLLITRGCSVSAVNNDQATPLHLAASEGNVKCLAKLLDHGADLTSVDQSGWTPLHWTANQGHLDCCRHLLERGARIDTVNNVSWTPIHQAINSGHADCLQLLLTSKSKSTNHGPGRESCDNLVDDVISLVDKDGWTVAHLAAIRETKDCLEVLVNQCSNLDLEQTDKWSRNVQEVASPQCQLYLQSLESETEKLCKVYINVPESHANKVVDSEWHIGNSVITSDMGWAGLEECLAAIFLSHLSEVEAGVKTRRMKQEGGASSPDGQLPFSLGLSLNSVKYYSIGVYHWSPGTPTERTPWELLASMNTAVVAIQLFGMDDGCVDSLAYETLIPVAVMQNYLRLMEQYKNVIFYGPMGTGKTYMAENLAKVILLKERHKGCTEIHKVTLTDAFTPQDLANVLIEKDCLLESTMPVTPGSKLTILILDDLHEVSVAALFKEVFPVIENRGPGTTVRLHTERGELDYYMHPGCYILGTMDRPRSTGLELSIQQRFRWVQFRCDQEPMRCLLHRHLQRRLVSSHGGKLPSSDDKVHKTLEWIVCVWQRLNEGIGKLGLLDLCYGPVVFLSCPVEPNKPKAILRWLSLLWNHHLAPEVSEAVLRGSGSDTALGGQQKVANTALYVLMQRAIVSGCPLSGQEKERYLSSFLGSNELDIKMRNERKDSTSSTDSPQTSRKLGPDIIRTSPAPAISPVNINVPFHRTPRGPITKAASLDSALEEPDLLELPEQPAYHTSPDLSPNSPDNPNNPYGNTYFALAGFPVAKSIQRPDLGLSNSPVLRSSKFGIPVIVTQPGSTAGSPSIVGISRSADGSIQDRGRAGEMKRALSPQPLGTKAWSPGPDPRRALSPGPDFFRSQHNKVIERNGNLLTKSDAIRVSRPTAIRSGNKSVAPRSPQPARFSPPVVVNPTKLPPFSNSSPPAFKS